jgi:hypothetical protein
MSINAYGMMIINKGILVAFALTEQNATLALNKTKTHQRKLQTKEKISIGWEVQRN